MATDFWSEYRRLKKKQLEDTNVNAPVKETTTSSSSDEGSVFWDEYRQNKKDQITSTATETAKKDEKEKEEKKAEQKTLQKRTSTTSQTSDKLVNGKLMQTQTKQVIKEDGVSPGDIAPVKKGGGGGSFSEARTAEAALKDPDFGKYAKQGAKIANPSFADATKILGIAGWYPFADEINNPVTFVKANSEDVRLAAADNTKIRGINYLWSNMTDDEVSVYNYYLAKYGKDEAEKYLETIENELSKREGTARAENIGGNKVAEVLLAGGAGVEGAMNGLTQGTVNLVTGSKDHIMKTPTQYADEILSQDNEGALKVAHDVVYGVGNMAPSIAVGIINPIAGAATMGAGVAGNKYNEKIEEGYSVEEAQGVAVLTGVSEGLLQYAMGGIGKLGGKAGGKVLSKILPKGADKVAEVVAKVAAKTPRIVQALGHAAVEMGKEGTEEALQTYLEPLFDSWVTDKAYEAPDFEDVVYNAMIGALTSFGLEGAPSIVGSTVNTIAHRELNAEGYTKDEQSVIDRVTEERIAEKEKGGEELRFSEKQEIKKKVQEDLDKGYLDADTLDEMFGGDEYKAYTDAVEKEDSLRKEYDDLRTVTNPTLEQQSRWNELQSTKDSFMSDDNRNALRAKAQEATWNRLKDSRLAETLRERNRANLKFSDDPSSYKNENARKTVENIINSGLMNNSNRAHEMASNLVKYSEERNVTVELTDNKKLKEEGKAYTFKKDTTADGNSAVFSLGMRNIDSDFQPVVTVNGETVSNYTVDYEKGKITFDSPVATDSVVHVEYQKVSAMNGSYNPDNRVITINIDSPEAWQVTVGHEVTHSLEELGDLYTKYGSVLRKYAEKKGEYNMIRDAVSGTYNKSDDINREVTAILTSEYLFTDEAFVEHLSTNHRNIFQKIYDEIKHLYNMVTAGSQEAREMEKVKHTFEKLYREQADAKAQKNTVIGEQHSVSVESELDGQKIDPVRFSLDVPIEETRELMAIHNLHTDEVLKQLEMGGLVYPSVAVTNPAKIPNGDFGDVSIILKKDAVDPKSNKYNKIYSTDAYTPTFPHISYEANSDVAESVIARVKAQFDKLHDYYQRSIRSLRDYTNLNDVLNRWGGFDGMINNYIDDHGMKQLYLAEKGEAVPMVIDRTETELTDYEKLQYQTVVDRLGESEINALNDRGYFNTLGDARMSWTKEHLDVLKDIYADLWASDGTMTKSEAMEIADEQKLFYWYKEAIAALHYLENGGVTISEKENLDATNAKVDEKVARSDYKQWLYELFSGIEGKSGIRNNKDTFLPSGKRRSFSQLHDPVTIDNVIKAMRKKGQQGEGAFGIGNIFGASAESYNSIAEAKKHSGELGVIEQAEYDAIKKRVEDRLFDIAGRYANGKDIIDAKNTLVEAVAKHEGKSQIAKYLQQYDYVYRYNDAIADDLISLRNYIRSLPRPYFEAKPQRAVSFDEVGVFVIPRNADVKLKQELLNRGYNIAEYDPDIEGDRQKVVNSFEEYKFSLADAAVPQIKGGDWRTPVRDLRYSKTEDIAPIAKADVADNNVGNIGVSDNVAPIPVEEEETVVQDAPVDDIKITTAKERIGAKLSNTQTEIDRNNQLRAEAKAGYDEKIAALQKLYDGKKNKDTKTANNILRRIERLRRLSGNVDADYAKRIHDLEGRRASLSGQMNQDHTKADRLELAYARIDRDLEQRMAELDSEFAQRRAEMEESLADRNAFISEEAGRLYDELASLRKGVRASKELGYLLDHGFDWKSLKAALVNVKRSPGEVWNVESEVEPLVREAIAETYDARAAEFAGLDSEYAQEAERLEADAEAARADARKAEERLTRKALHQSIVEKIKTRFAHLGYDFDTVLKRAKDLSTFATVDNTPQRVLEKSLGYEEGGILADLTVNQVAQNESEAIRWLNSFTNRKSGLLAELSRQYRIKPGSKESAAAQMYAEGFYVGKNDEIIAYSDNELAIDFPDTATQDRIKGLARDPRIRLVYDQTLDMINESRTRNAYPEIPRLDNYFLHFRAMEDTFSKLGLPFNPNDIRAKDLPTDLNGVTADLKPGQPYFASAMHREGNRTSFDLLGGMERYLSSAKNQIFHIDDIQTLRALRNYIADTYGQANGLESLDSLTEEEVQDRIKDVFGAHLSTFAKFLNEEANIIAGKTSLADRGIEGILGRRAITFLNDVNRQVGANMVGYNASSALTNFIPVVQTFAKANKAAFVKAFAQTVSNRIGGIAGRSDGFAEASPVMIRRAGADRFHRTLWQKMSDPGYALMGAVDSISTEIVARTKYNELTKKGMNSEQAHIEADKWASRLMGDRSLGQLPHLFESKMLGLVTKFQLEVRNQLDSMFYDTIQEAKASNKDIENALARNAKTAAKVASTFFGLAVSQHLFGKVFESIAGYNPAFDIIDVIAKTFGLDDDDDSEDTVLDNVEQGFLALLEDLPYTSTLSGGRIPISSALPITEFIKGKDEYGNEKSRLKTLSEAAPYYILPGGYGQIKKTAKGLSMFDDDHPVSGSYTDSGNLRFPVEDTVPNRIQAALFGQWANENARDYIENNRKALSPKQVDEYVSSGMTIGDYWDYREGLSGLSKIEEKAAYINGLDIPVWKKNLLINNLTDRKDPISMEEYATYGSIAEADFAKDNPARYELLKRNGVTYEQYQAFDESKKNAYSWAAKYPEKYEFIESLGYTVDDYAEASDDEKDAWTWAYNNPEKYEVSKAITGDLFEYFQYKKEINAVEGKKDANGKTISGSLKDNVEEYIANMDIDFGAKLLLFKMTYPKDNTYNNDIIDYLNSRDDLTYEQIVIILKELGFNVSGNDVTW